MRFLLLLYEIDLKMYENERRKYWLKILKLTKCLIIRVLKILA
jgi:hypothetical protein